MPLRRYYPKGKAPYTVQYLSGKGEKKVSKARRYAGHKLKVNSLGKNTAFTRKHGIVNHDLRKKAADIIRARKHSTVKNKWRV